MPKSVFLLLFLVLPFVGMAQSARRTNKLLKQEYDLALRSYDSILRINDSIGDLYSIVTRDLLKARTGFFEKIDEAKNARYEALSLYQKLESIGIAERLEINFQMLDTVTIPYNVKLLEETASLQNGLKKVEKQTFELRLDDLSIKAQNELLASSVSEIRLTIELVQNVTVKFIADTPQLKNKGNELLLAGDQVDVFIINLYSKIFYLKQQKEQAKMNYLTKGPKGFNENYALLFPEIVFLSEPLNSVEEDIVSSDKVALVYGSEHMPDYRQPPVQRPEIYDVVDESPEFPGGITKLKEFITANLKYPETAVQKGIEGRCYLRFIVSMQGKISNVVVIHGVPNCPECDKEAVRMAKSMSYWAPGKINGKPVNSWFYLPVSFKLP